MMRKGCAWVLVFVLLLSQYLGVVHTISHDSGLVRAPVLGADSSFVQAMIDSHLDQELSSGSDSKGAFNLGCKLFDAAMLSLGLTSGLVLIEFLRLSFANLLVADLIGPPSIKLWFYPSRAPPLICS